MPSYLLIDYDYTICLVSRCFCGWDSLQLFSNLYLNVTTE
jgi:hypothetical protein